VFQPEAFLRIIETTQNQARVQPRGRFVPGKVPKAGPFIIFGNQDKPFTNGIAMNIFGYGSGIAVRLDKDRFVSALEEVPRSSVLGVEMDRISAIDEMHDLGKIRPWSF
jgi:hypothetical protein